MQSACTGSAAFTRSAKGGSSALAKKAAGLTRSVFGYNSRLG